MTDPISDMLTQIRNAAAVRKPEVVLSYSHFKENLAKLFLRQGWLNDVQSVEKDQRKFLTLSLKYQGNGLPTIGGLKRISKPGQRIYVKNSEISKLRLGVGATILSTSKGLMTDQEARKEKTGGEVVCQVW